MKSKRLVTPIKHLELSALLFCLYKLTLSTPLIACKGKILKAKKSFKTKAKTSFFNVNLHFISSIQAPSVLCDICIWKLWLTVGGAFSQLLAQSGIKKTALGKDINRANFKCLTGSKIDQHNNLDWLQASSYHFKQKSSRPLIEFRQTATEHTSNVTNYRRYITSFLEHIHD